ncbi:MAG: hypothetical protein D6730_14135 [Bacteroidetes bacterium]|nr:MAG: hypothetical protein D6730_14135 [Bacteroidota bacterium]
MYSQNKTWILAILAAMPLWGMTQPHNGEIYRQLVQNYFSAHGNHFLRVQGQPLAEFMPPYTIDSLAGSSLIVGLPTVKYGRVGKRHFSRTLGLSLSLQDSSVRPMYVSYTDTLEKKVLLRLYRQSPDQLKGDKPTAMARWIFPLALISGSVGGVLALFFVRS